MLSAVLNIYFNIYVVLKLEVVVEGVISDKAYAYKLLASSYIMSLMVDLEHNQLGSGCSLACLVLPPKHWPLCI